MTESVNESKNRVAGPRFSRTSCFVTFPSFANSKVESLKTFPSIILGFVGIGRIQLVRYIATEKLKKTLFHIEKKQLLSTDFGLKGSISQMFLLSDILIVVCQKCLSNLSNFLMPFFDEWVKKIYDLTEGNRCCIHKKKSDLFLQIGLLSILLFTITSGLLHRKHQQLLPSLPHS